MNRLLIVTTLIETGAGLALLSRPSEVVDLLLGSPLDTAAGGTLGRLAGAALLALGIACWLAHQDGQSAAARGVLAATIA